jgi:hypothetical protein
MEEFKIRPLNDREMRKQLSSLLCGKVFHATDEYGFQGIKTSGFVLTASDLESRFVKWPSMNSYFRNRGYVSFCDFYHAKNYRVVKKGYLKYRFWSQRSDSVCLLLLKENQYSSLLTWYDLVTTDWVKEMVVPHIESGLKAPVPIEYFSGVVRVDMCKINVLTKKLERIVPRKPFESRQDI